MQLGILLDVQEGIGWEEWRRLVPLVEALGFESLWRSDHLFSLFDHPERPGLECWTALAWAAEHTSRVAIGPLVSPVTFRHPSLLALQAATVDALSGGRLVVGIGAGWHAGEHRAFGVPFPPAAERIERLGEAAALLKALLGGGMATYQGKYSTLEGAVAHPRPPRRPPLLIAGGGERRTLRVVAEHADEWNVPGLSPARYREKRAALERHCAEVGRDPAEIARSVTSLFVVGTSAAEIERRTADREAYAYTWVPADTPRRAEAFRELGWLYGRPEEVTEQIQALAAEGVQRLVLQPLGPTDEAELRLIAERILPPVA